MGHGMSATQWSPDSSLMYCMGVYTGPESEVVDEMLILRCLMLAWVEAFRQEWQDLATLPKDEGA